jgi:PadR family transcriptional regulator, regulatory protein PadR
MADARMDLLPGTLDMLILRTLTLGPMHGYAVARRIQQTSGEVLKVEEGSLYPALHRMERRGWIESHWGPSESNRRARFYRLTPAGRRRLATDRLEWQRLADAIGKVLALEERSSA